MLESILNFLKDPRVYVITIILIALLGALLITIAIVSPHSFYLAVEGVFNVTPVANSALEAYTRCLESGSLYCGQILEPFKGEEEQEPDESGSFPLLARSFA